MIRIIFLFVIGSCCISWSALGGEIKIYQGIKTAAPPKIDGVLEDPCWGKAKSVDHFFSNQRKDAPITTGQTFFSVLYDETNLYVGIECEELINIGQLVAAPTRSGPEIKEDDCVEIFIDSNYDKSAYFHFMINCIGATFAERRAGNLEKPLDAVRAARTHIGEKSWSVEVAIPFSALETTPGKSGLFGLNVCRRHYAGGKRESTTWASLSGEFNQPGKFGILLLENYMSSFKQKILLPRQERYQKERKEILNVISRAEGGALSAKLTEEFNKMDRSIKESMELILKKEMASAEEIKSFGEKTDMLLDELYDLKMKCYANLDQGLWI